MAQNHHVQDFVVENHSGIKTTYEQQAVAELSNFFSAGTLFEGQWTVWLLGILVLTVLLRAIIHRQRLPPGVQPLPGIRGLPYIGAPWGVPIAGAEQAWHFAKLHAKYGPIYQWRAMGTTHVWIESVDIARDLLHDRGKKYGGRHEIAAAVGIKDGSEFVPLMNIGDDFWRHKNFIHALNRNANADSIFFDYPELENINTLARLLDHPDKWSEQIITHCARVAARIAWGDPRHGTKLLHIVPILLKNISPSGPIPNLLPFLMHLPAWLSPWKAVEAQRKQQMQDAFYEAQEDVIQRYDDGTAEGSWTKLWLDKAKGLEKDNLTEHEAAHAVGSNALVAIVTIGSPIHSFFTAMCHYPSWQPRLQEELDRICPDRLPTMKDIPNLPVLRAVVKETLRWRQPTPLGVPHILTNDDVYDGYHIPKDAMIHANHYFIAREPNRYPEPNEWRPERWLDPSWPTYKEPLSEFPTLRGDVGFGYGVRSCPGIDLVTTELYTTIGSIAWAFNITRKEGRAGHDNRVPWYETNPYVITIASQFPCNIEPRSAEKAKFIRDNCEDASLLVKSKGERSEGQFAKWDILRPEDRTFDWEGLTRPVDSGKAGSRVYDEGI